MRQRLTRAMQAQVTTDDRQVLSLVSEVNQWHVCLRVQVLAGSRYDSTLIKVIAVADQVVRAAREKV